MEAPKYAQFGVLFMSQLKINLILKSEYCTKYFQKYIQQIFLKIICLPSYIDDD
jgi:hypothetical protein